MDWNCIEYKNEGGAFLPTGVHDITVHLLRSFSFLSFNEYFVIIFINVLLRVPKTTVRFSDLLGLRTLHTAVLIATIFCIKRVQGKSVKGKGMWGKVQRKPDTGFQEFPSADS